MNQIPHITVEHLAKTAILAGANTEQVIEAVNILKPDSAITHKSVATYRKQLRKAGLLPPVKRRASSTIADNSSEGSD